jgi:hypothetical protein
MGGLPPKPNGNKAVRLSYTAFCLPIRGRVASPKPPAKGSYPDERKLLKADLSWLIKLFLWQIGKF